MPKPKSDGGSIQPTQKDIISYARSSLGEVVGKENVGGLTLRDYFAAKAMQALIQNPDPCFLRGPDINYIAEASYKFSDAMLIARELPDA